MSEISLSRAQSETLASARVAADREHVRRAGFTLPMAGRAFWKHPSPWILASLLVGSLIARVLAGGFTIMDLVVPAIQVATFPILEWLIHVFVLHAKPRSLGPVTVDTLLARKHRAHHADPRDLPLLFIPWPTYFWMVPSLVAVAVFAFPRLGLGLSFLVTIAALGCVYEWVHYLVHTDYKPKSKPYRAVWRSHRFHHYKNENYWFTVTTTATADRLFGTYPDPTKVATSPTAKNLHG